MNCAPRHVVRIAEGRRGPEKSNYKVRSVRSLAILHLESRARPLEVLLRQVLDEINTKEEAFEMMMLAS